MNLKHSALIAIAGAVVGIAPGIAWSGQKYGYPVNVNTEERWAAGSLGTARNSANVYEYIGCYMYAIPSLNDALGVCVAVTADSRVGSCYFQDKPAFAAVLQSVGSDSALYFQWDEAGACQFVQVENFSQYEPKQ